MSGTLAAAVLAYSHLLARWGVAFGPGDLGKYVGLVISNSWGVFDPSWDFPAGHPGRYIDNPRHPFNLLVGVLASSGMRSFSRPAIAVRNAPMLDAVERLQQSPEQMLLTTF